MSTLPFVLGQTSNYQLEEVNFSEDFESDLEHLQIDKNTLYFSTENTLYRFNGTEVTTINLPSEEKLLHVSVLEGLIFAQQAQQLFIFPEVQTSKTQSVYFDEPISTIAQYTPNSYLVGTKTRGCFLLTKEINAPPKLTPLTETKNDVINKIQMTDGGYVLATDNGLLFNESGDWHRVTKADGLPDYIVTDITLEGNTVLGICYDKTLFRANVNTKHVEVIDSPTLLVEDIEQTNVGLYLTSSEGVFLLKDGAWTKLHPIQASKILLDKQENIFFNSSNNSLFKKSLLVNVVQKPSNRDGYTIIQINDQELWEGTENGINRYLDFTAGKNGQLNFTPLHAKTPVVNMVRKGDHIFAATMGNGVYKLNKNGEILQRLSTDDGLVHDNILSMKLYESDLWMTTLGGLSVVDVETFTVHDNYSVKDGLPATYIYDIELVNEDVFLGTDGMGLVSWNYVTGHTERIDLGIDNAVIYNIDRQTEKLWVSVEDHGVVEIDSGKVRHHNENSGLSTNQIVDIVTDDEFVFLAHELGVDVITTKDEAFSIHNRNREELNLHAGALFNGKLIVSYGGHFLVFNPTEPLPEPSITLYEPSHGYISKSKKSNKFKTTDNSFEFKYSGVWNKTPKRLTYAYRLVGSESDWFYTQEQRVFYNNLGAGNYSFQVGAVLHENTEPTSTESYQFIVLKPFYLQTSFLLLLTGFLVLTAFFLQKNREKGLLKKQELAQAKLKLEYDHLKNQINPHFLHNSFNSLSLLIEENPKNAVNYVNKLSRFFRRSLQSNPNQTVPIAEEVSLVEDYVALQQLRFGDKLKITNRIPSDIEVFVVPMALQLLVENALKHNEISSENPLTVELFVENQYFVVQNNKLLKTQPLQSTKLGLQNINHQYQMIENKNIIVEDSTDIFRVKLPILQEPANLKL